MSILRNTLNMFLVGMATLALGIMANTYDAPQGNFVGTPAQVQHAEDVLNQNQNVPHFSEFANAPVARWCHKVTKVTEVPNGVLIVDINREAHVVSFDRAWALTHRSKHSDVWVIGYCN